MKTERNILIAFILNLAFSIFEFVGGLLTGSVAILSDALHDLGDAMSIGISFLLEKKSRRQPDLTYTYGYGRYSVLGGLITTAVLLFGSAAVIWHAVERIINPVAIHYSGMIVFALAGAAVNLAAAFVTREGDSVNQRAVNLHMLEDVLGWIVVLVGAVVMHFTDLSVIDPIMSMAVAAVILFNAVKNMKEALEIFLEKTPDDIDIVHLKEHLCRIDGVSDVHHVHVWSMDGQNHYATMHVRTDAPPHEMKEKIRMELQAHGICHATLELETAHECCHQEFCHTPHKHAAGHHHHHPH